MDLYEAVLTRYCNEKRISIHKAEAALDYLRDLVKDAKAEPPRLLTRPFTKYLYRDLIELAQELASYKVAELDDGLDMYQRLLLSELNWVDTFQDMVDLVMDYFDAYRANKAARVPAKIDMYWVERVRAYVNEYPAGVNV
jgi:hypothetical protein